MIWQSPIVALLIGSLVRPVVLIAAAGLLLRALKVRHPSSRHAVWTAVLLGMLLLPAASLVAPHWHLPLPPGRTTTVGPEQNAGSRPFALNSQPSSGALAHPGNVAPPESHATRLNLPPVGAMILAAYFAGLLAMLTYWAVGWLLLRRLVARSRPLKTPWLRESTDIASPVTAGLLSPVIIVPTGWRAWSVTARNTVFAHECAHIRRHDPAVLTLSRLVECVFWFNPVAWWLSRKIADLAELACDAAVLEKTNDPGGYSRTLIEFAAAVNAVRHRTALPGLAMARPGAALSRRIDQLFELSRRPMRKLARPGLLLGIVAMPVLGFAATVAWGVADATPKQAAAAGLTFDVASIKLWVPAPRNGDGTSTILDPNCQGVVGGGDPGLLRCRNVSLSFMIQTAYNIKPDQLTALGWMNDGAAPRFEIVATTGEHGVSADRLREMEQNLLAQRFGLVIHHVKKELPTEALAVAKGGPKLTESAPGNPNSPVTQHAPSEPPPPPRQPLIGPDGYAVLPKDGPPGGAIMTNTPEGIRLVTSRQTIKGLADLISLLTGQQVTDDTGLTGRYDIKLFFSRDGLTIGRGPSPGGSTGDAVAETPAPTLKQALQQLGLTLDRQLVMMDSIVVDKADKTPVQN